MIKHIINTFFVKGTTCPFSRGTTDWPLPENAWKTIQLTLETMNSRVIQTTSIDVINASRIHSLSSEMSRTRFSRSTYDGYFFIQSINKYFVMHKVTFWVTVVGWHLHQSLCVPESVSMWLSLWLCACVRVWLSLWLWACVCKSACMCGCPWVNGTPYILHAFCLLLIENSAVRQVHLPFNTILPLRDIATRQIILRQDHIEVLLITDQPCGPLVTHHPLPGKLHSLLLFLYLVTKQMLSSK